MHEGKIQKSKGTMQKRYNCFKKNQKILKASFLTARQFIDLFYHIDSPSNEEYFTLATAHYTLALQQNLSKNLCKMHLNSSITLLQNLPKADRCSHWQSLIANSYAKRAELLEQEDVLPQALNDYLRILALFEPHLNLKHSPVNPHSNSNILNATNTTNTTQNQPVNRFDSDRLLIAQTAISVADLILNQCFAVELYVDLALKEPIFYINTALENLSKLPQEEDEILLTLAYAQQISALAAAANHQDFPQALIRFRLALKYAFKASSKRSCHILGDIYNSLGLLFEQQNLCLTIEPETDQQSDHAFIYFALALFFCPTQTLIDNPIFTDYQHHQLNRNPEFTECTDGQEFLDIIFDNIHRTLEYNPYPISIEVLRDLIDALIYVYFCLIDNTLPNQAISKLLKQKEPLDHFVQHIYWLFSEYNRRKNQKSSLLSFMDEIEQNLSQDISDKICDFFNAPKKDNVIQFRKIKETF